MNAAITGGTGFLGQSLIPLLVPPADAVRVLVRREADDARIRLLGAEPIRGDLTAPGGCGQLVHTDDVLFHAAARVAMTGSWASFRRTTVDGTRRLLDHALARKPSRLVYVSSAAVYSPAAAGTAVCAERTRARPAAHNFYARAKLEAEELIRTRCDRATCPWTILRLGFLHGPGNRALVKHLTRLAEHRRLFMIGRGDNRIATVYVDDAARAVLLAGTHPTAEGKIYDVANDEPVTQRAFLQATTDALGLPPPRRYVPRALAYGAACFAELTARLTASEPPLTRAMITLMSADQILDAGRIREELGWKPEVQFAEGIRRTHEWHLEQSANKQPTGHQKRSKHMRRQSA